MVAPQLVSELIGIPIYENGNLPKVPEIFEMKNKRKYEKKFCGKQVEGRNQIWLKGGDMFPEYRILHFLFCANVYPRFGNRSDLN